jgi:hypothetical protein
MGVRQVTEDGPGKPTGQVVYVCEICKMETTRHYKATMRQPIQQQHGKSDTDNNGA